jgi:hypothetical protein
MVVEKMRLIDAIYREKITVEEAAAYRAQGYNNNSLITIDNSTDGYEMGMLLVERDPNSWVNLEFELDGAGSEIADNVQVVKRCPFTGVIKKWTVLSTDNTSGSIVLDIWKDTYANYRPTVSDTIVASDKPTISSAIKAEGTSLTGWTRFVSSGDIFVVNVDSCTSLKAATLSLTIEPSLSVKTW